jgi:hypothetical protein
MHAADQVLAGRVGAQVVRQVVPQQRRRIAEHHLPLAGLRQPGMLVHAEVPEMLVSVDDRAVVVHAAQSFRSVATSL